MHFLSAHPTCMPTPQQSLISLLTIGTGIFSLYKINRTLPNYIFSLKPQSIYLRLYSPLLHLGLYTVGGSTRRKAATYTQNNTNTESTHIDNHTSSGIRTQDPSVRAGEDGSCLRQLGHCDRSINPNGLLNTRF
jgi:hypothetical protein